MDQEAVADVLEDLQDAVPPPAVRRHQRRHRHFRHPMLPARPKKPANRYTMYLKHYFSTHPPPPGVSARQMLVQAGAEWRNLDEHDKEHFGERCRDEQERYRSEIRIWNRQKTVLKRPPSAYALFLKDFYERERGNEVLQGTVVQVGRRIKREWDNAPQDVKDQYRLRNEQARINYRSRMDDLEEGNVQVVDLVNLAVRDENNNNNRQEDIEVDGEGNGNEGLQEDGEGNGNEGLQEDGEGNEGILAQ